MPRPQTVAFAGTLGEDGQAEADGDGNGNSALGDDLEKWLANRLEAERRLLVNGLDNFLEQSYSKMVSELTAVRAGQQVATVHEVFERGYSIEGMTSMMSAATSTPPAPKVAPRKVEEQGAASADVEDIQLATTQTGNQSDVEGFGGPQYGFGGPQAKKDQPTVGVETSPPANENGDDGSKGYEAGRYYYDRDSRCSRTESMSSAVIDEGKTLLQRIVDSPYFEAIAMLLIIANTVSMVLQIQVQGYQNGYDLGLDEYSIPASEAYPGVEGALDVLDFLFTMLFLIELVMRITALRVKAFSSGWIWLDAILVAASLMELANLTVLDPTVLRTMRLIRVLRTMRLGQLASWVEDLFLLTRSLRASMGCLFWSFIMIFLVQLAVGMVLNQALAKTISNSEASRSLREESFAYFGTFTKTMITMFELTFANWVVPARAIANVHEAYAYFCIAYRCVLCFALVKVIAAVFIAETNRVVASDDEISSLKRKKAQEDYFKQLRRMFSDLDIDGDGLVTWEEFSSVMHNDGIQQTAAKLDIQVVDLDHLFRTIDSMGAADGMIGIDEFMAGLQAMKSPAVAIDLINVLKVACRVETLVQEMHKMQIAAAGTQAEEEGEKHGRKKKRRQAHHLPVTMGLVQEKASQKLHEKLKERETKGLIPAGIFS